MTDTGSIDLVTGEGDSPNVPSAIMLRIMEGLGDYGKGRTGDEASLEIVAAIMDAENPDDVFSSRGLIHAEDVKGIALYITGFRVNRGDFGAYFVIDAVNVSGGAVRVRDEEGAFRVYDHGDAFDPGISCGSVFVMAQLAKCVREQWLPYTAKLIERETGGGFTVLRLVKAEREAFDVPVIDAVE